MDGPVAFACQLKNSINNSGENNMIKFVRAGSVIACGFTLTACAAIFDGTTQKIYVTSHPAGATCDLERKGASIATVSPTPGFAKIRKTKDDIMISCHKDGYQDAKYNNHSGVAGATFGDIAGGVLTGGIAWAIDSGTGADNKYDGSVSVTLVPANGAPAAAAAPAASPVPVGQTSSAAHPTSSAAAPTS